MGKKGPNPNRIKRDEKVREAWNKLKGNGLRTQVAIERLADQFNTEEQTIEKIVYEIGRYAPPPAEPEGYGNLFSQKQKSNQS